MKTLHQLTKEVSGEFNSSKMAEPSECAREDISSDLTMREALSLSVSLPPHGS